MDTPVVITVDLISDITGSPKDGPDPSQYFKGRDNDKRLVAQLKQRYDLQHDGMVYHIEIINDGTIRIAERILASKII